MEALYYTVAELAARGQGDIPREMSSSNHLIYSSPATLAFNSPGAEGYGVKRAGLAVPDSVMLIVSPGCCGRNTSAISRMPGYEGRFFYLTMDETDLVTGRHLKRIPRAVLEICRELDAAGRRPRAVMICITCVDALLGTDMERVCRRCEELLRERLPGIAPGKISAADRAEALETVSAAEWGGASKKMPCTEQRGTSETAAALEGRSFPKDGHEIRVRPCYMYALTREGRKPPMVHVRQSIYELLEPRKKKPSSVNLLGFFAPLREESELPELLGQAGVRAVRQIGACGSYEEFRRMAEANFNLVLNPEARPAAYDLQKRLGIPFIELVRFYQIDRIRAQYAALGQVLGITFDDGGWETQAREAVEAFRRECPDAVFSVGEAMNGSPFELACALVREGFPVREIFGTLTEDSYVWIRLLADLSPDTRVYSNLHPTMLHYGRDPEEGISGGTGAGNCCSGSKANSTEIGRAGVLRETGAGNCCRGSKANSTGIGGEGVLRETGDRGITITIGRDAAWYHPGLPNVQWNTDAQPWGYTAVTGLFRALLDAAAGRAGDGSFSSAILLGEKSREEKESVEKAFERKKTLEKASPERVSAGPLPKGFHSHTTPFAPDQSGAVSVLYDMGGICVVCDAGGCTGNICGFDEPRWFGEQSAVFSAGLRDMDAILGRDDRLVEKLALAAAQVPAKFAAIVGTPVPAVIGTDYRALCRLASKKTGLRVVGIDTDGMEYYDRGMEKTYLALLEAFCAGTGGSASEEAASDSAEAIASASERKAADFAGIGITASEGSAPDSARPKASTSEEAASYCAKTGISASEGAAPSGCGKRIAAVWGYSPLDFSGILPPDRLRSALLEQGYDEVICCGAGAAPGDLSRLNLVEKNIVVSPAGAAAAKWLEKRFGTPWEYGIPGTEGLFSRFLDAISPGLPEASLSELKPSDELENISAHCSEGSGSDPASCRDAAPGRRVLVIHQQVLASLLCGRLREKGMEADAASFFMMAQDLLRPGDVRLREESDLRRLVMERGYEIVIADRALAPLLEGLPAAVLHLPHFAVSGEQAAGGAGL